MKSFIEHARFYAQYHQKSETFYTHVVGIPLILFALMIFLGFIHLVVPGVMDTSFAFLATFALWIYYLRLNWRLGLLILPMLIILLWLSGLISDAGPTAGAVWVFIIAFALGWALQLIGHMIEGQRPAFMDNLWQMVIAPLYVVAELCFRFGYMKTLQSEIHNEEIIKQ